MTTLKKKGPRRKRGGTLAKPDLQTSIPKEFAMSQRLICELFDIREPVFSNWKIPPAYRIGRRKIYDARVVFVEVVRPRLQPEQDGGVLDLNAERAKLARAQTQKHELDLAEREGELIHRDDVIATWSDIVVAIRARLLALARLMPGHRRTGDSADDITRSVERAVRESLEELERFDPIEGRAEVSGPGGNGAMGAPAGPDGEPMG